MATKKIYIGSFGPFIYDDEADINDVDGDFTGETLQAVRSDGAAGFDGDFSVGGDLDVTGDAEVTGVVSAASLALADTNASHHLSLTWNEDDSADRVLNLLVAGGTRSLTLNENFTIGDGSAGTLTFGSVCTLTVELASVLNQDLTTDAGVTFATVNALTLTAAATGFTIAGGTTPKTLTVDETKSLSHYLLADGSRALAGRWDMFNEVATDRWTDVDSNTIFGINACQGGNMSGAINNTAYGYGAGFSLTGGDDNTFIGYSAGSNVTDGIRNMIIGSYAGDALIDGSNNLAIGYGALSSETGGSESTAIGSAALGDQNVNATARNTAIGRTAGTYNVTGTYNTCIGFEAGKGVTGNSHSRNTLIGAGAGNVITTGSYNTCIGYYCGDLITTGSYNIIIGYNIDPSANNATYEINIGSTYYGKTDTHRAGINVQAPLAQLHVDQSVSDAAIPVLILDQADVSEPAALIGDGGSTNYLEIESDGTIEFHGTATVFDDINLGAAVLQLASANNPSLDEFKDEAGADTGITTFAFGVGDLVSGTIEIPHDYKGESDITPHVHFQIIGAPAGGTDNVKWQLIYTIGKTGETLDAVTTLVKESAVTTQYAFYRFDFPVISGTDVNFEDHIAFQLQRVAASADGYAGDLLLGTVGFHYEIDTIGSRTIDTK